MQYCRTLLNPECHPCDDSLSESVKRDSRKKRRPCPLPRGRQASTRVQPIGMSECPVEPHLVGLSPEALPYLQRGKLRLVLEHVRSAFNTGALFRTADAAAVEKIYLVGVTPHPPQAQVEKTALGATRYVPWLHREKSSEVIEELRLDGYSLVALDNGPGAVDFWDFCWPERTALIAGSEVDGVSEEMLKACSGRVNIPMYGFKRSLNVTTALGIAMYEYLRTFRCGQGLTPTESEQAPMRGDTR